MVFGHTSDGISVDILVNVDVHTPNVHDDVDVMIPIKII